MLTQREVRLQGRASLSLPQVRSLIVLRLARFHPIRLDCKANRRQAPLDMGFALMRRRAVMPRQGDAVLAGPS